MKTRNLIFSAVEVLLVLFVLAVGLLFICIPHSAGVRDGLIQLLLHKPKFFLAVGNIALLVGALLFFSFLALNRRRYLKLEMDVSLDRDVLSDYTSLYWKERFPSIRSVPEVILHGDRLEVVGMLPSLQEAVKVEAEFGAILRDRIGYKGSFYFTAVEGSPHRPSKGLVPPPVPLELQT